MKRSFVETVLGGIVLLSALVFSVFFLSVVSSKAVSNTYPVIALFNSAGGIKKGADVRLSGIIVGEVSDITLDTENYKAKLTLDIASDLQLPDDTLVEIASDGFLGGKYIRLKVGRNTSTVKDKGLLSNTKDVETLESMLGKLIFLTTQ